MIPFKSINESLSNHSKAKQTHSFSRQLRFKPNDSMLKPPYSRCPISTYDGKVMKGQQKGGVIGSSKRQTFTLEAAYSPGSNRYNINTTFDSNVSKNKGYTLTLNREVACK